MHFSAVILNGGKSSRMGGKPKDTLWLRGSTLINTQINNLSKVFDSIIIIGKQVSHPRIKNTFSDIYKNAGPLAGIHSALTNTSSDYIFLFSCDMPFISLDLVISMIDEINNESHQALIPLHLNGAEPLHAIYHKSVLPIVKKLLENKSYRFQSLFNYIDTKYYHIDKKFNPDEVFFNINKPEDLVKANNHAKRIIE